jgi:hypothetical protein
VKGAGSSSRRNTPRAQKGRIGIGQWEKRMVDKKTRTLERRKGVAPKVQKHSKAGPPACLEQSEKFLNGHPRMADEGAKSTHR